MSDDYDFEYKKKIEDKYAVKNCVIPPSDTNDSTGKVKTKHGNPATGIGKFFIEQLDKKKKKGELDKDTKEEIYRAFGSSGEGAYVVHEREYLTDRNGTRY